jgi:transcriptional regulator with XRE-family HTH domain
VLYNVQMNLGKNIAIRRNELDITQEDLGNACGVTSQAVSAWERDENYPEIEKIPLIADKLQMPLGWPFNDPRLAADERLLAIWGTGRNRPVEGSK